MGLGRGFSKEIPIDEAPDGFFSPWYPPFGFLPLWDAWGVVPCKGTGETTDKEEDVINDDEY